MAAFHEAHFSKSATDHFHTHFLRPDHPLPQHQDTATYNVVGEEEYYEDDEEDDGLGYYPDGVKRTLTDEQIAIFRHSELEALRRARESSKIKKAIMSAASDQEGDQEQEVDLAADDDISEEAAAAAPAKKSKKRKRGKGKNKNKKNTAGGGGEHIDLRKRTWDVVGEGLDSLDYDDDEAQPVEATAVQRRRISYDD